MVTGRPGSAGSGIGVRESWRAWMPACVTAGDVNASRVIAWVRERPGARCGDAGREAVVHGSVKRMTESSTADHWMKPLLHDGDPLSPGTFGPSMFFLDPGSFNVASPSADSTPHPAALRFRDPAPSRALLPDSDAVPLWSSSPVLDVLAFRHAIPFSASSPSRVAPATDVPLPSRHPIASLAEVA